jgi:L-serine dehydratase
MPEPASRTPGSSRLERPPVETSIFELFKAGPGPSSSHTIAPMRAGLDFRALIDALPPEVKNRAASLNMRLLGSLSATGRGHGTPLAVLTGLAGFTPRACPEDLPAGFPDLSAERRTLRLGENSIVLDTDNVLFGEIDHPYPYSNTLVGELREANGALLLERVYFSVGGGFLQWAGWEPPKRGKQPFPYGTAAALRAHAEENDLSIPDIIMSNEMALTGRTRQEIQRDLDEAIEIMRNSVQRGLRREGPLPGPLGVYRKAMQLARKADASDSSLNRFLGLLNAYAFAVAEENAAGGIIITAPTCGSAGVMAAVLTIMEGYLGFGPEAVREAFLAASSVGFLARHNAGIAGAEVGCQGEVGVASAMAAAMLAQARGFAPRVVENAAEVALEHHLGLTCDPVGGYVQIPCIERNAMGALKAYNACLVASAEEPGKHRVSLDAAIMAMGETGHDMNAKYKETAGGGLATSWFAC